MFQNAFRNVTCERPPRPRLFGTGPFLDGAATPPLQRVRPDRPGLMARNSKIGLCKLLKSLTRFSSSLRTRGICPLEFIYSLYDCRHKSGAGINLSVTGH